MRDILIYLSEILPTIIRYIVSLIALFFVIKYAVRSALKAQKDDDNQKKL